MLVEAAWTILRRGNAANGALHLWARRIAVRRGSPVAVLALARKLAGILYAIWREGTRFEARSAQAEGDVTTAVAA